MKTMKASKVLAHERYAMMRFFDHGSFYLCGTFDDLKAAQDTCAEMNRKMRPMYGEDQYEVVAIDHE